MRQRGRAVPPFFERPADWLVATEGLRSVADLYTFWAALPGLLSGASGDGHGVLVLPGFLADDFSTPGLRGLLRARGYHAEGWQLGANLDPTERLWNGVASQMERLREIPGRPVSLIGQSLGGVFARELARRFPDRVRQVITLARRTV